jgi:hypothetical protein
MDQVTVGTLADEGSTIKQSFQELCRYVRRRRHIHSQLNIVIKSIKRTTCLRASTHLRFYLS